MIVDYYYSVLSDWAYFGGEAFEKLALRYGATVRYKPICLADIYTRTGGIILQERSQQRQDYRVTELVRWSKHLGIPVELFPKHYPTSDKLASCMIVAAAETGQSPGKLSNCILRAIWAENRQISDPETLVQIACGIGLNGQELLERAQQPETASAWMSNTDEAIALGVFGSPFYLCEGHLFWGQDRLPFLEAVLNGSVTPLEL